MLQPFQVILVPWIDRKYKSATVILFTLYFMNESSSESKLYGLNFTPKMTESTEKKKKKYQEICHHPNVLELTLYCCMPGHFKLSYL